MRGSAAYALFVLACAVPGWLLRDIVAAEAQLHKPLIGTIRFWTPSGLCGLTLPALRKLGPTGQEYLWRVLRTTPDADRRTRASTLILTYDTPTAASCLIESLSDASLHDRAELEWWVYDLRKKSAVSAALCEMSERDFLRVLHRTKAPYFRTMLVTTLWHRRPEAAEHVASLWIRETSDLVAVRGLSGNPEWCGREGPRDEQARQLARTLYSAGRENPHAEIRDYCASQLAKLEREGR